jgi:hypothetical protein
MRIHPRVLALLVALPLIASSFAPSVSAAPVGITSETAVSVNFGYQYQPASVVAFGASYEMPVPLVAFLDTSVVGKAGFSLAGGFDVGATLKAIVFPSLSGGLLAAGLWLDISAYNVASSLVAVKAGFGPMLTVNLEPLYLTFSASLLALTNAVFGFDLGIAARYYIDAFALDLSVDYNTVGWARANFGVRFTL